MGHFHLHCLHCDALQSCTCCNHALSPCLWGGGHISHSFNYITYLAFKDSRSAFTPPHTMERFTFWLPSTHVSMVRCWFFSFCCCFGFNIQPSGWKHFSFSSNLTHKMLLTAFHIPQRAHTHTIFTISPTLPKLYGYLSLSCR